jgi:hypothetical protein
MQVIFNNNYEDQGCNGREMIALGIRSEIGWHPSCANRHTGRTANLRIAVVEWRYRLNAVVAGLGSP